MSDRCLILVDPAYDHGRGRGILCRDTVGIGPNDVNVMVMRACGPVAVAVPLERALTLRTLGAWDAAPADFILFGEESGTGDQPRLVASSAG